MSLLRQLAERAVALVINDEPWKRKRARITAAQKRAAQEKLAESLRQKRQEQAERWRSEQEELLVKASELPPGVKIVESQGQEGIGSCDH